MKLCFSTLGCVGYTAREAAALAHRFGIGNIELRGLDGYLQNAEIPSFAAENRETLRAFFASENISPAVLGTSCSFHDPSKTDAMIAAGRNDIDLARALGIPYIRVFGNKCPDESTPALVASSIAGLCAYDENVTVLLEVHGDFNRAETLAPVLEKLSDVPNFGLIWDIAHTFRYYGRDFETVYPLIFPFVRHVHIKDAVKGEKKSVLTLPGMGEIPIIPIVEKLLSDGYDGCFSLEWEKHWHPELPPIEDALSAFAGIMGSV